MSPSLVNLTGAGGVPGGTALRKAAGRWIGCGLKIELPNGSLIELGDSSEGERAVMRLNRYRALRRALVGGDIGFAAGYIAGDWDTPDLARLLAVLAANFEALGRLAAGIPVSRLFQLRLKLLRANTLRGSRRNIHAHYDLGNAFYEAWLDSGMTYSGAIFAHANEPLEAAQQRKYAALAEMIDLKRGQSVLEMGCGWGGFAEFAAREFDARVTAVTISAAQYAYAQARLARVGLSDRVEVKLRDYRHVAGRYDRVVSIEMFEAVGERYWPVFFEMLRERMAPGGRVGLQMITIRDDLFADYRRRVDFIQRYVFPGGMLPSQRRLAQAAGRSGLRCSGATRLGSHYVQTLRAWSERFERAWPQLKDARFDERFRRLWRFYLSYCEAGFVTGRTDLIQLALVPA